MDRDVRGLSRRTVLRSVAGAGALSVAGGASAHEWGSTTTTQEGHDHTDLDQHENLAANADRVGYHSLGGVGPARQAGRPEEPHHGGLTEIRVHGDYAYVGVYSAKPPTPGRGLAVLDISGYTTAETEADLAAASLTVLSFYDNPDPAAAVMDVKVSDDGEYVFLGKQPFGAVSGATDPTLADARGGGAGANSVEVVDVSDPGNPERVAAVDGFTTGIHNVFHHRIDGEDYVFAVKDINVGDAGLYVFAFDRRAGTLTPVNRFTVAGDGTGRNNAAGEASPTGGLDFYCHDIEVQDDPVTGRPTGYLSYWDAGVRVVDLSDPTDIVEVGHFRMRQGHFATPAPTLVDGTRVFVASHEEPSSDADAATRDAETNPKRNPDTSGSVFLVDADGIYEDEGVTDCELLDDWFWREDVTFGNFELSPHNSDFARHIDPETGAESFWVHQAHYHGGVRFLKVVGDGDGLGLAERGHYRPHAEIPEAARAGLSSGAPDVWSAAQAGGVTFAADINQGVYALKHDAIPLSGPAPFARVDRRDDGAAFRGGATNQVDLDLTAADGDLLLRDRVPDGWRVAGGARSTDAAGDPEGQGVAAFGTPASAGDSRRYFAEAPDATGTYTFGPVEVSDDGGERWHAVPGTTRTVAVVGLGMAGQGLTLGAAAGAVGALGSQRDRLGARVRGALGDDEQ
jgi:hypothetical protein